jgi:hypothetical protein
MTLMPNIQVLNDGPTVGLLIIAEQNLFAFLLFFTNRLEVFRSVCIIQQNVDDLNFCNWKTSLIRIFLSVLRILYAKNAKKSWINSKFYPSNQTKKQNIQG